MLRALALARRGCAVALKEVRSAGANRGERNPNLERAAVAAISCAKGNARSSQDVIVSGKGARNAVTDDAILGAPRKGVGLPPHEAFMKAIDAKPLPDPLLSRKERQAGSCRWRRSER